MGGKGTKKETREGGRKEKGREKRKCIKNERKEMDREKEEGKRKKEGRCKRKERKTIN